MTPRELTDDELALVGFAFLGERAPHFAEFVRMKVVGADTEPQPVCDYPRKVAMLLYTADYGRPN